MDGTTTKTPSSFKGEGRGGSESPEILSYYDLAELYGVETRVLIQGIKRNRDRFPEDFMFQLTKEEVTSLISQNAMSKQGRERRMRGGRKIGQHSY